MAFEFVEEIKRNDKESTPTLSTVLRRAMDSLSAEMRVCIPAEVIKYDKDKQSVDVRPYIKRKYADGQAQTPPIIYNVPVAFHRAGNAYIAMPLEVGHSVLLVFSDRSIEKWLSSGAQTDPEDTRKHHIADAIAIPGCYPFSNPASIPNATDVIIKNDNLQMRVKKNGHLQVINQTNELVKVLNDMLQIIREAVVYTSTGPQLLRHSKFSEVASRLKTFLEK